MTRLLDSVHRPRKTFLSGEEKCHYYCDTKALGILTKEIHSLGVLNVTPESPADDYPRRSVMAFHQDIQDSVVARTKDFRCRKQPERCPNQSLHRNIVESLDDACEQIHGLEMEDFLHSVRR